MFRNIFGNIFKQYPFHGQSSVTYGLQGNEEDGACEGQKRFYTLCTKVKLIVEDIVCAS